MHNHDIPSPLALYLRRHPRTRQVDICRKMTRRLGREVSTASVAQYATGVRVPGPLEQEALMVATSGGVRPSHWHKWQVRVARKAQSNTQP